MTTYVPGNPVYGDTLGRPEAWIGWAEAQGARRMPDVRAYVETVYRYAPLIGVGGHKVVCQSIHETTADGVPWASEAWTACVNPAGIGVTDDSKRTWHDFGDGRTAALAHLVHLSLYVLGEIPDVLADARDLDPRWRNVTASILGRKRTLASFGGSTPDEPTWAVDPQYGKKWADTLTALAPLFTPAPSSTSQQGTPTMTTYQIPGLPGGPLDLSFPMYTKLIPASRTYQRPGIFAGAPRESVQHGNGNDDSTAAGEATYLYNGAEGRQASYHYSVDDREGWCMVPLNEVTWQAADGSGPGNMRGFSCEMVEDAAIWANPSRAMACIDHNAELMGKTAARLGVSTPKQHYDFNWADPNRHDCPNKLRYRWINGRKAWDIYVERYHFYRNTELARMGKATAKPTPATAPEGWTAGAVVRATAVLNMRWEAGLSWSVKDVMDAGTEATVLRTPLAADGYVWYPVQVTPTRNGWVAGDFLELVTPAPKEQPTYAKPLPIPALLGTDLQKYDTAPGIVTDEANTFVFVADVIEVTADSLPVLQYAGAKAPRLRADLQKGDRFVGAWLVTAADGKPYYVGCEPDWWRVPYEGTKRIADAPLLPGSERA